MSARESASDETNACRRQVSRPGVAETFCATAWVSASGGRPHGHRSRPVSLSVSRQGKTSRRCAHSASEHPSTLQARTAPLLLPPSGRGAARPITRRAPLQPFHTPLGGGVEPLKNSPPAYPSISFRVGRAGEKKWKPQLLVLQPGRAGSTLRQNGNRSSGSILPCLLFKQPVGS